MSNPADKTKLVVRSGFSTIIALGIVLSIFSLYQLQNFRDSMTMLVENNNKKTEYAYTMRDAILRRAISLRDMAAMQDVFERDEELLNFNHYATRYAIAREKLISLTTNSIENEIFNNINKIINQAYPVNHEAARLLIKNTDQHAINTAITEAFTKQKGVLAALDELVSLQKSYATTAVKNAKAKYMDTVSLIVAAGVIGILLAFLIIRYVSHHVTRNNKILMDATYTKSMFVANMSHEIRTPLTAIIGFAKTLLDKRLTEQRKEKAIRTVIRNGEHLLGIINDILDLSKIEANQLNVEKTEFSLFGVLNDVYNILRDQASEKGIEFKFNYIYPLPEFITSDPVRLKQIVLNLCSNAMKFTEQGYVHVNVRYDRFHYKLVIDVQDSGIGMDEAQQVKVFQAFTQADISTTRKFGGTGLGLPISQQLAEKLGGNISVASRPGQGSCFTLVITTQENTQASIVYRKPEQQDVNVIAELNIANSVQGNILLVEDMPDNRELIGFLLEDMGANVVMANNGQEAVDLCMQNIFDLVLMDMQMPVMGGVDAVRTLRMNNYHAPIVMLSANAMLPEQDKCFQAGCDGFLVKPIDENKLYNAVKKYLLERQGFEIKTATGMAESPSNTENDIIISTLLL